VILDGNLGPPYSVRGERAAPLPSSAPLVTGEVFGRATVAVRSGRVLGQLGAAVKGDEGEEGREECGRRKWGWEGGEWEEVRSRKKGRCRRWREGE